MSQKIDNLKRMGISFGIVALVAAIWVSLVLRDKNVGYWIIVCTFGAALVAWAVRRKIWRRRR